eukprot:7474567-Pyramimonas_sp.AAC.1
MGRISARAPKAIGARPDGARAVNEGPEYLDIQAPRAHPPLPLLGGAGACRREAAPRPAGGTAE